MQTRLSRLAVNHFYIGFGGTDIKFEDEYNFLFVFNRHDIGSLG